MAHFHHHRVHVRYGELAGLSGCGFRKRDVPLSELFPTADEIALPMTGCLQKVGSSISVIYEVPELRFDVADDHQVLELAVPNPKSAHIAVIVDVLALDNETAEQTFRDIEETCRIVRAKHTEVISIIESSEEEHMQRLKDSMEFLRGKLHKQKA